MPLNRWQPAYPMDRICCFLQIFGVSHIQSSMCLDGWIVPPFICINIKIAELYLERPLRSEVNKMSRRNGDKTRFLREPLCGTAGNLTADTLFRGITPGDLVGPNLPAHITC
jgi:hypothetical protein